MKIPSLNLKAFKEKPNELKYLLPYGFIIEPNFCLLKNGAVMTTYQVEYPDLESSSAESIASVSAMFNRSLMSLAQTEGWAIFFDVRRQKTTEYPAGTFDNLAGWLIDRKRADNYKNYGDHFTSVYYITMVYQLPSETETKSKAFFLKSGGSLFGGKNLPLIQKELKSFSDECSKAMGALDTKLWIHHLDASELFTYIKTNVSLFSEPLVYPEDTFFFLDNYISDRNVYTSMPLKIGEYYCPIIGVNSFPNSTFPAMFDRLNRSDVEYRWTTRFIPLTKQESLKEVKHYQDKWFSARKSAGTIFTELAFDTELDKVNSGAVALESEASQINEEITLGDYVIGYYTSNLMCYDQDLEKAREKSKQLQQIVKSCGFGCKEETVNNFSAWLGMMAGNVYSNVRRPLITTQNVSNIIPLSSAWQGALNNDFTLETCGSSVPLCTCSTSYGTPFFLNINHGDVGHTFIFGPTGAGKSTLISLLIAQATKYKDANVICLDKQLSSRAFMIAGGGIYVEPGKDTVAFQPLGELKDPNTVSPEVYLESLMWCQQFVEGLLVQQNITLDAHISKAVNEALKLVSEKPVKDITTLRQYIVYEDPISRENTLKVALEPYCEGGQFGSIFDASETNLELSRLMTIEMGTLMRLSDKAVAPALMYIFRYLENIWNVPKGAKQPLTFLFLDEAWLYLQHPIFANFIQEWLRTLRKKKVFCIFATQEVSAVTKSSLKDTISQQCLTKIYLADENATNPTQAESYREFGLSDSEIVGLANATMKHDYYFKNPHGSRMFSLDLDAFQLALISPDHEILDMVESLYGKNTGNPLAFEILDATKEKALRMNGNNSYILGAYNYEPYKAMLEA